MFETNVIITEIHETSKRISELVLKLYQSIGDDVPQSNRPVSSEDETDQPEKKGN